MNETIRSYDRDAAAYVEAGAVVPDSVRADIEDFAARLGPGARVLEIGSGGGRNAALMEELGLRVRRTDVTPAFVELLRAHGHEADLLDPLTDDLTFPDGPYDAVWANASLLHVARDDLPTVVSRLADVTRPRGTAPDRAQAGRPRRLVDPRLDHRPAPLHLLAGRAAAGGRSRRRLARRGHRRRAGHQARRVLARAVRSVRPRCGRCLTPGATPTRLRA